MADEEDELPKPEEIEIETETQTCTKIQIQMKKLLTVMYLLQRIMHLHWSLGNHHL